MQKYIMPPTGAQIWDGTFPPAQPWKHQLKAAGKASAFDGGGTEGNPWQIKTSTDLAQLSADVAAGNSHLGEYFKLMNNISLNTRAIDPTKVNPAKQGAAGYTGGTVNHWTPIGGSGAGDTTTQKAYGFEGSFDGNGFSILNVFFNMQDPNVGKGLHPENQVGIFGDIYSSGSVKNLNTAGGYIGGNTSVGGIVGRSWGAKITNCHNGNFVYGIGSQGTGGVAGTSWTYIPAPNEGGAITIPRIDKCSNTAMVVSNYKKNGTKPSGSAGGIVGENEGPVYNSWNEGIVSCLMNAAGIVGSNQNESSQGDIKISVPGFVFNCYNTGNIGVSALTGSIPAVTADYAGGILGYQTGSCENVYNKGNITANSGGAAGQIISEMNTVVDDVDIQTNNYFNSFTGASPSLQIGIRKSGSVGSDLYTFDSSQKGNLLDKLNAWIENPPVIGCLSWIRDTTDAKNGGYPTLDI